MDVMCVAHCFCLASFAVCVSAVVEVRGRLYWDGQEIRRRPGLREAASPKG